MSRPNWRELADILLTHSIRLRAGERVVLETFDLEDESLLRAQVRETHRRGGGLLLSSWSTATLRELIATANADQLAAWAAEDARRLAGSDAYIALRGDQNPSEWANVPPAAWNRYNEHYLRPVHWELRIPRKRWCLVRLPGPALAQLACLPLEELLERYWAAVSLDYPRFRAAIEPLRLRLAQARRVRVVAPGTDLHFELAAVEPIACAGEKNVPDGEVFTAPVLDSVEGEIQFNTRTHFQGVAFEAIGLRFERGRVVASSCRGGQESRLQRVLQADDGACRVGEWAIGCNPRISRPFGDPLLDEKVAGSHHLALGFCYPEASNGNASRIHWDLVQLLGEEHGGGLIELDGQPFLRDGQFLDAELDALNPLT